MRISHGWSWLPGGLRHLATSLGLIVALNSAATAQPPQIPLSPDTAQENEASYVPGELLVKFKESASEGKKANVHNKNGGQKLKEYKEFRLHRVKLKDTDKVRDAVKRYMGDPDVEYAEPNYRTKLQAAPNDPMLASLWGLAKIKAQQAWDASTGNRNVVVAVLDTGIDYRHPDLKDNLWLNTWDPANGVDNDANGYVDDTNGINAINGTDNIWDDNGHGTHVAGTIGASGNNGIGVTGVNWAVQLLPCKVLDAKGEGSVADSVESLIYLKALKERTQDPVNIAVVNASWALSQYSNSLYDAIRSMGDTLFVAAAGNKTLNSEVTPSFPANYRLPNIISVAATTSTDALASFSNYGKHLVDVAAPGVEILSTYPSSWYAGSNGTSMAAPHVSGLAALLKAQDSMRDGSKIRNLILSSGESVPALAGKIATGKRIDAAAATACFNRTLLAPGRLPFPASAGNSYTLSARSLNCASPAGPVTVTTSGGETIVLEDGGSQPDAYAGDGIFSASWTAGSFPVTLTFASPAGSTSVVLPPLKASYLIPDARAALPYYQPLTAEGGTSPYVWAITSGTLPAGLSLDPASGIISGTATVAGAYRFTAEVTDAQGEKVSAAVNLRVVTETVNQSWSRVFGGDGNDEGQGVINDPSGNLYVTGRIYNGASYDLFLSKYDPSGQLLWSRTHDAGSDESGYSLSRDSLGNIYVAGYSVLGTRYEVLLQKYSSAGSLAWSKRLLNLGVASMSQPSVTVGSDGNLFLVSAGRQPNGQEGVQLDKYDPAGNLLWSKMHQDVTVSFANSVAVDSSGNIYFGGSRMRGSNYDFLLVKYDASGNLAWTREVAEGVSVLESIAVDGVGNIIATGWTSLATSGYGVTFKYSPDGSQLWRTSTGDKSYLKSLSVIEGAIYATGQLETATGVDFATFKYDSAGTQVWKKTLDAGAKEYATGVVADAAGLTVVGYGQYGDNNEVLLARYSDSSVAVDDLVVTAVSGSLNGSTLSYSVTVRNNGTGNAAATLGLYLSADNVASTADHAVTYLSANNLAGGTEKTLVGTVIVPNSIPGGTYYIAAVADPGSGVLETDETNNGLATAASYLFTPDSGDLQVTGVSGSVAAGSLSYSVTVANTGASNVPATMTTLYLWSGGSVITLDNPVTSLSTGAIAAGGETVLTGSVPLPANVQQGTYYLLAKADTSNNVSEINETNNGTVGNEIILTNDLIISAVSGTLTGGTLSYSITVGNLGNAAANAPVSFYLSSDATASTSDILIRQLSAGTIAGGSSNSVTGTITIPASVPPGSYYLAAVVDPANVVSEADDSNNGAVAQQFTFASDLEVTAFSATLSQGKVNYSVTVRNAGNLASTAVTSTVYLSTDSVASTSDARLVSFITLALAPGASRTTTASVAVPTTTPPGSYRGAVIVDSSNLVLESDETNNSAIAEPFPLANDVTLTGLTGSMNAGVLSYSVTVINSGSGSATIPVHLYLSQDASASTSDALIKLLAGVSIPGGTQKVLSGTLAVPSSIPSGTYYLAALADPANVLAETDETNNGATAEQVTITSDLQLTAVTATLAAGRVNYSLTVKNAGTVNAPSSKTGLYLSADGVVGSDFLVASVSTPSLPAGEERVVTGSAAVPATIPPGSYTVAAIADTANVLKEAVETNNSIMGNQVAIANDLSLGALSGSLSGGMLTYAVTVSNSGTGNATAPVTLYLSADTVASTNDIVVKQLSASTVAGGTGKVLTGTVAVPATVPAGSYYLAAITDPANVVAESSEVNNGAVAESVTITSDLEVTAVSATLAGGSLSYSITVRNNGNIGTPNTKTKLYLSADNTAATSDLLVSTISTSSIPAGSEKVLAGSVAVPAVTAPGTYYVAAIADGENVVLEGAEANNGAAGNQVTLANDLSVTGLTGSLSAGVLSYSVTVRNTGTGSASAPVYLYFSADSTASTSDLVIKQLSATAVPGGTDKVLTGSFAVPGTVPSGSYYLTAVADPAGAVPETNEGNNSAVAENYAITCDLQISGISATLDAGRVTYAVTVRNAGNIVTPSTKTNLYLSVDGIASTAGALLGSISTSAIAPGTEKVLTGSYAVPATVAPGSYYVTAIADATGVVSETVETGNGSVGNQVTLSNDLSVTALSGSLANGVLTYSMTVRNSGTGNPSVAAKLYFSTDNSVSLSDIVLKDVSVGSVPGGTDKVVTGSITVPGTVPSGTYYLAALVDPANALAETVETDNGAVASQFTVNSELQVVAVSATVSGGRATYSVTVRNSGNIASAATSTGLYLSTDAVAASSDILLAALSTSAIPAGTDKVLTGSAAVPASVGPGSYYVAAIADTANGAKESNEANNTMVGNQLSLSNDISITAVSGTLSGGVLSYSVTVANAGNLSPAVSVALSFSTDAVASAGDYHLKTVSSSIPGGSEKVLTGTVTVPDSVPNGSLYLVALADPAGTVAETDEGNNGRGGAQFAVNKDLQVTAVSGSVAAGVLSYSVTVTNAGNIAAAASSTGVYLSADGTPSLSDYRVATHSTSSVPAGGVKVFTGKVTIPATVPAGTYYLTGIADAAGAVAESAEGNNGAVGGTVTR